MNAAIEWFARNHVAANILMALLVVAGIFSLPRIRQEVFPELTLPIVNVTVAYPGASPSEVEQSICVRIEEALQGLAGVKRLHATAGEGSGAVNVELLAGEDADIRINEIRTRVEGIDGFPESAEKPVVSKAALRFQVVDVAVSGNVDEATLKRLGERARDEIEALPEVTDVELVGARPYEIAIQLSEAALRRHGVSFDDVAAAVRRSSLDMPGGSVKTAGGEILIRTRGQAHRGDEFAALPLVSGRDGTRLTLGEIATIEDGFEETDHRMRFDGEPAVVVKVFRVGEQSALEISASVKRYLEQASANLPDGVSFTLAQDDARFLRDRLDTLLSNARGGFLLVLLVLASFLRLRLASWVTLGIPLSFLGALAMMPALDVSINLISLLAFIVVLGIVVDDAIVVGEHAHSEQARTGDALRGAILGAQGVATPVTFGVLTTIAAFAPMLFIPGPMGRIARVVPLVVIACLVFSLLESLFVLPAHLGHGAQVDAPPKSRIGALWLRVQGRIAGGLAYVIEQPYRRTLERALEWRYLTIALALASLILTAGLLSGGWLRFVFQPDVEGDVMVAYVNLARGVPVEETAAAVAKIAAAADAVQNEVAAEGADATSGSLFAHVLTSVGQQPYKLKQATGPSAFAAAHARGGHLGEVQVEVVPAEQRSIGVAELTRRWRERTGAIVGAEELRFSSTIMSAGAPVDIELRGTDLDEMRMAADLLAQRLASYDGVLDIRDSFRGGKQEVELAILPSAESLGLTASDLARQVRQAFYGEEVQRIQRGRHEVPIVVRYPASDRRSLGDLENMRIRTAEGFAVPFSAVAEATFGEGFSSIRRVDRRRIVSVTAGIDLQRANANEVVASVKRDVVPELAARFPDIDVSFGGEQREQTEFLSSLARGWTVAMLVVYALLAMPLRSYLQPFIIMSAVPFGLVGAVWGHALLGHPFSMFSLIGVVALSGIVVNDSLVLVDFMNRRREVGRPLREALVAAGQSRFRAILLTSLTTFAGLTPLLLETSVQAQMLIPMAISLAFGVLFATLITLLLVPALYLILEDLVTWGREALGWASLANSPEARDPLPATSGRPSA